MTQSIVNREEINSGRPVKNQKAPRANAIKKRYLKNRPEVFEMMRFQKTIS